VAIDAHRTDRIRRVAVMAVALVGSLVLVLALEAIATT
jgi:hypothetical protein